MRTIPRFLFSAAVLCLLITESFAAKPYNLLIIQTDEHHFSTLGCYGGNIVETPHIDSLAKQGAICTSFLCDDSCLFAVSRIVGLRYVSPEDARCN